jgi:hypothetical protein
MKRFNVITLASTGGVEVHAMKQWLREHPEHPDILPLGLDPTTSTSHQLRNALKRRGWSVRETPTEVQLIAPEAAIEVIKIWPEDEQDDGEQEGEESQQHKPFFSLEYQLRDFIAQNLGALDVGSRTLKLYVDPTGRDGIEFPTAVGPIDILATDEAGAFFVFELKRASSPDHAIGQLARYMGWVNQTIGKDRRVHGIIVARTISDRLRYAVSVIPNVSLFEYEVEFHLKPADNLTGA